MKLSSLSIIIVLLFATLSCDQNDNFIVFSINDDIELGEQVKTEIANDPSYTLLSPSQYPEAYNYLYSIRDAILNSGEIAYKEEFAWDVIIVHDDNVQNAFAIPGGHMYIYTGLIKYLDHADDLAGVMAHEMAHADERHTVRNLQKVYGVNILLAIALGNDPSSLEQIAAQLAGTVAGLSFSRDFEREADANSVDYLTTTKYACNGAASFFIKMEALGEGSQTPQFLSTHPNPENRIEDINSRAEEKDCDTSLASDTNYDAFKASLP